MTVQTWPICLGADPGFAKGEGTDHGEHAECELVKGVWRSPRQGLGAELLVGNEGAKFPEAESLLSIFIQKRRQKLRI